MSGDSIDTGPYLADWTKRYIENKDIVLQKIVSIEKTENGLFVKFKDKEQTFVSVPFVKDVKDVLEKLKKIENYKTLVVLNSLANLKAVINNWNDFVSLGNKFNIYFINPFSKTERIWILSPYTHNFIADVDSLELGLKTMSENVEYVASEEKIKEIIS